MMKREGLSRKRIGKSVSYQNDNFIISYPVWDITETTGRDNAFYPLSSPPAKGGTQVTQRLASFGPVLRLMGFVGEKGNN